MDICPKCRELFCKKCNKSMDLKDEQREYASAGSCSCSSYDITIVAKLYQCKRCKQAKMTLVSE